MRTHEDILAMVTVIEAKQTAILDRHRFITQIAVAKRSAADKAFMLRGGGTRECQALHNQLDALAWVLEQC